jgi:uncharacterized membrane protein
MSKQKWALIGGLLVLALLFWVPGIGQKRLAAQTVEADEIETMVAEVIEVLEEGTVDLGGGEPVRYQRLRLRVQSGSMIGEIIENDADSLNLMAGEEGYAVGDRVYVESVPGPEGRRFYVSGFVRTRYLMWIGGLFVVAVAIIGWGKGLRSLLGAGVSLVVIFAFIVPQILAGRDPLLVCILGAIMLLASSTYLIYGWTAKAHAAVIGMSLSLALTGLLAERFAAWTHLTGLGSEASTFLAIELGSEVNLSGLILGGIIIGALGVLDDICLGQASAAFELAQADPDQSWSAILAGTMRIGQDHIAAAVNTLLLAYVGSSLPLLLLFAVYQEPLIQRLNREPITEEIVRTLVGSMGLVLAVPITALVASLLAHWTIEKDADTWDVRPEQVMSFDRE